MYKFIVHALIYIHILFPVRAFGTDEHTERMNLQKFRTNLDAACTYRLAKRIHSIRPVIIMHEGAWQCSKLEMYGHVPYNFEL